MLVICSGVFIYLMINLDGTVKDLAITLIGQKEVQTKNKLDQFFKPIAVDLDIAVKRGQNHIFDGVGREDFNTYFFPFVESSDAISSLLLADDEGNEYMLLQLDSSWATRVTIKGSEEGVPISLEWRMVGENPSKIREFELEEAYDPRQRPWFVNAMNSDAVSWTEPYTFFTTKEPGITASKKWIDNNGTSKVLAFDIKLSDISKYTSNLDIGANGKAFILTGDERVLGLPYDSLANSNTYLRSKVLLSVDELGNHTLSEAVKAWVACDRGGNAFSFTEGGEAWMASILPYRLGEQVFYIGVMAPEADFLTEIRYSQALTIAGYIVILLFIFTITRAYSIKRKSHKQLEKKNKEIEKQSDLIRQEHIVAEERRLVVEKANKEILSSISYAKRLQSAILPPENIVNDNFDDAFVLYKPKDIVAGDFYWMAIEGDTTFIAAADCTGHGVPGAILSIVCNNALNRAVKEFDTKNTGSVLDRVSEIVSGTFREGGELVADGMDISLLSIDKSARKVQWSGANNRLWYVQGGGLKEIKGNRQPIGFFAERKNFTTHDIEYVEGTSFYLITDGIIDQFGGDEGKKFKYTNFRKLLRTIHNHEMKHQKEMVEATFEEWKGSLNQVDDVCVIGLRF